MFFKRSKGDFRETERITRYKLIKSGKNWVRASVSRLGLFRVMRGGVDENIVVQYEASSHSMPADLVKGMVVLGALAGATTVANPVFAEENEMNATVGLKSAHRPVWLDKIALSWERRLPQTLCQRITPWVNPSHFQSQLVKASLYLNRYLWVNLMLSVLQRVRPLQKLLVALSQRMILFM